MKTVADPDAITKNARTTAAQGAQCLVSIAAVPGEFHAIDAIHGSFSGDPGAAKSLTIEHDVNTTKWVTRIIEAGDFSILFPKGLYVSTVNKAMHITLEATVGDGNVVGKLNVLYR